MILADIMFYIFSIVIVFCALMVISVRSQVHAVLFLIFAFFNAAGLFILLNAEFIAMLLVIVYVGAVAVLFLFVVMMLNVDHKNIKCELVKSLPVGILIAVILFGELLLVIFSSIDNKSGVAKISYPQSNDIENIKQIGALLYTDYVYQFQISGMILLVAMIGAILLTNRTRSGVRKQNVAKQIARKKEDGVEIIKVQIGQGV